ncbi:MAG TPA: cytochrome P450, partial [Solirubrobacterales bacterium]|nr:cytochrome P450 [Solirubrobacterales bacterium]
GVLAQTVAFHRRPLEYLRACQAEFGDAFTLRLLTARPLAVVADPEAARALLDADPGRAEAGAGRRRILPFASERSVFGGDGEGHRAARERIEPALSPAAMAARRPAMIAIAERQASFWPRHRPFQLLSQMRTLCDEIFVRLVLGVRDDDVAVSLAAAIGRMLRTPGNPPLTLPGPGDGTAGTLGEWLFAWRRTGVARELHRAIAARRAEEAVASPAGSAEGSGGSDGSKSPPNLADDVLGRMIGSHPALSDEEIVDELLSLLMAAQEPPAIALTWLLDRLSREPERAVAFAEDPTGPAADAIVRETLRLRPPASGVLRRLAEPLRAGGRELPAGLTVLVPSALLNRDPRAYEAADEFRPERWDGAEPPVPFFPFGGGARRCVGEHLARAEIETVVPALLRAVKLAPLAPEPEPMVQRATVLVPRRSLLVRAV